MASKIRLHSDKILPLEKFCTVASVHVAEDWPYLKSWLTLHKLEFGRKISLNLVLLNKNIIKKFYLDSAYCILALCYDLDHF